MSARAKRARKRPWLWLVFGVSLGAGGLLAANAWVAARGGPIFERPHQVPAAAVAIVLGARVHQDGTPFPALEDRLYAALELWRAGKVRRILVSGDHHQHGYDEVNGMQRWLVAQGVPHSDIFLDHAGLRTLDTMARAAKVFGANQAVVCTQRFHLPRALFLARAHGIDAVGLVADRREYPKARWDAVREAGARLMAVLDVHVLHTGPRHLGPLIPLDGPAQASWDAATQRRAGK